MLGALGLAFALVQAALAWFGHRRTVAPSELAAKAGSDASLFLQSKLRNAEVLESMGMLRSLQVRWAGRHQAFLNQSTAAQDLTLRITAWSKCFEFHSSSFGCL